MSVVVLWAHAALPSVRDVPIFAFLIAPYLAAELTALMRRASEQAKDAQALGAILNRLGDEHRAGLLRCSLILPAFEYAWFLNQVGITK